MECKICKLISSDKDRTPVDIPRVYLWKLLTSTSALSQSQQEWGRRPLEWERLSGLCCRGILWESVVSHFDVSEGDVCPFCGRFIDGAEWLVARVKHLRQRLSQLHHGECLYFVSLLSTDINHCCLHLGISSQLIPDLLSNSVRSSEDFTLMVQTDTSCQAKWKKTHKDIQHQEREASGAYSWGIVSVAQHFSALPKLWAHGWPSTTVTHFPRQSVGWPAASYNTKPTKAFSGFCGWSLNISQQ